MFAALGAQLEVISIGLVSLAAVAGLLALVVTAMINLWGVIDPRMGQMVKGALLRIAFSMALLAAAAGGSSVVVLH